MKQVVALRDTLSFFHRGLLCCRSTEDVLRLFSETTHVRCILLGSINSDQNIFNSSGILCNGTVENDYSIPLSSSVAQLFTDVITEKIIDISSSFSRYDDPVKNLFSFSYGMGISFTVEGGNETNVLLVLNDAPFPTEDEIQLLFSKTVLFLQLLKSNERRLKNEDQSRFFEQTRNKMASMSHMAARIAHDFNNIIGAIGGYSSLLKKKLGEDHPNIRYVNNIMNAGATGSDLTNQLSFIVRNVTQLKDSIDVHSMISSVLEHIRDNNENRITVSSTFSAKKYHILGNEVLLRNIVSNLAQNAVNACRENHGTVFITTSDYLIKSDSPLCDNFSIKPGGAICISIKDSGSGIQKEYFNRVFDPYYTTLPKGKGDGLGLSFLWTYIETYHGALEFNSTPNVGTTLKIFFTADLPEDEQSADDQSDTKSITSILIVDDEPSIRDIYTEVLSENGYEVFSVCDGSEVIPFMENTSSSIDLVLLDMVMPKMNGIETFKALRARYRNIPILLMSGLATSSSLSSLLEEPATAFFNKSLNYTDLISIISERF